MNLSYISNLDLTDFAEWTQITPPTPRPCDPLPNSYLSIPHHPDLVTYWGHFCKSSSFTPWKMWAQVTSGNWVSSIFLEWYCSIHHWKLSRLYSKHKWFRRCFSMFLLILLVKNIDTMQLDEICFSTCPATQRQSPHRRRRACPRRRRWPQIGTTERSEFLRGWGFHTGTPMWRCTPPRWSAGKFIFHLKIECEFSQVVCS